jgi:CRISPR-associated protein Cas2
MVLVSYDIRTTSVNGEKRLRRLSKMCRDFGQRVQYSVFEVEMDHAQWILLKSRLCGVIDPEQDSLRFYYLGRNWRKRVEHVGTKPALDLNGVLVF